MLIMYIIYIISPLLLDKAMIVLHSHSHEMEGVCVMCLFKMLKSGP